MQQIKLRGFETQVKTLINNELCYRSKKYWKGF